ncbi:hypothetical protein ACHWQZ_G001961 [Mnemiopsis leidyi]
MRRWVITLLLFVIPCSCLTEEELEIVKKVIDNRPNIVVNGINSSKLELVVNQNAGLLTFRTNSRPGYIEPSKAGYPLDKDMEVNIPKYPMYANVSSCIPTGEPLGITLQGTLIYSVSLPRPGCPQADERRIGDGVPDGVTRPDWDECGGRVGDEDKTYRVYTWSPCLETLTCSKPSELIGIAFDGFPIYGPIDETGRQLTTKDLDECHGKVSSNGNYRYHATVDYPYFVSCYKGIVHEKVGIEYPIECACPFDDTRYIDPQRILFPNYTIAYEWVPIYRDLALLPCKLCTEVNKYNTASTSGSWLNYNKVKQKVQVCNVTTEHRFTEVIKRRLTQGRLPPELEYEFFSSLKNQGSQNNDNAALSPKTNSAGRICTDINTKSLVISLCLITFIFYF